MSILSRVKDFFFKGKPQTRGYQELSALNAQNEDWKLLILGEDADVKQNIMTLRSRSRDLWKSNPYFIAYRDELYANVFGEHGIMLRSKVRETEDRAVHAPDEKAALRIYWARREKVARYLAAKSGKRIDEMIRTYDRAKATVIAGELDVFANKVIEESWKEWKDARFCDVRGRRDYKVLQQLRLMSAARDGDHFIIKVRGKDVNKFGFAIQLVNAEYVDPWLNLALPNGNEIRMGVEYQMNPMGLEKIVAFYFLERHPRDWEWGTVGQFGFKSGVTHRRIDAVDVIHYARFSDADSSRPAPWGASVFPKSRQLDQYELAEVIAARTAACKMGFLYSDLVAEGGDAGTPDPTKLNRNRMNATPGGFQGLPYGVKLQEFNPNHPNQNYDQFRKGQLRSWCAGMPGANYNIIGKDAEGVSYSTGRIFSLDDRELWKLIQRFDIDVAERPIFESWLESALSFRAIPLPLAKYTKFNKPHFSGRRWQWVDPSKDAQANREQLLLGLTSRARLCDDMGVDFDDILFEIAEEEMLIAEFGLNAISLESLASKGAAPEKPKDEEAEPEEEMPEMPKNGTKPAPKKGKKSGRLDILPS